MNGASEIAIAPLRKRQSTTTARDVQTVRAPTARATATAFVGGAATPRRVLAAFGESAASPSLP
jgi:hypothetical protein